MSCKLCEFTTGDSLYSVTGRGIVLALMLTKDTHRVGDRWTFVFEDHEHTVEVRGVERATFFKGVGLCFGSPFSKNEIEQIKKGNFKITTNIE